MLSKSKWFFFDVCCSLLLNLDSPVTGQTVDISRGRGGPRVPNGASAAPPSSWSGGRTPMAAADSSRTPAWGGPSSARSKCQRVDSDHFHMLTLSSTCLGRSRWWFSHSRLENGRLSHIEPIRRQPHSLRRIRRWRTHPSLERRRPHAIRRQL